MFGAMVAPSTGYSFPLTAGWLGLRVWGQTGPPAGGARSSNRSCCRLGRERFGFDIGDSDQPRSCFTWRGAFAAASSPPASPCGDTDGYIEGCRSPTGVRSTHALARLPWAWLMARARRGGGGYGEGARISGTD